METLLFAFSMGLLSAASLPLGTLTTAIWQPSHRTVALLMAFGGGALLAALTIDLVGSALEAGQFGPLAIGALVGGLLFDLLNQVVNKKGGFLRKSSTVLHQLERQRQRRFRHILQDMGGLDVFKGLPQAEAQQLAGLVESWTLAEGDQIYEAGEPPEGLYVVDEGAVRLVCPDGALAERLVEANGCFGRLPFFTNSPHRFTAQAVRETRLWFLPMEALPNLVPGCPALARRVQVYLEGAEVAAFLTERHGLRPEQVHDWVERAVTALHLGEELPEAAEAQRDVEEFDSIAANLSRLPVFSHLTGPERRALAGRVFLRHCKRGEELFRSGQPSDRLFIVERGEVLLLDGSKGGQPGEAAEGDVVGGLSFLTGARHSKTGIAQADTTLWVLRKRDFEALLRQHPSLGERVRAFLQDGQARDYLRARQNFDARQAARWTDAVARDVANHGIIPSAAEASRDLSKHGAPMAIWLGITLDGIPESLVIGSSLIHSHISLSLLAGLFLSNYPEALSSSVGMRHQGMAFPKVLAMWTSITLMTGIGAALGNLFFQGADPVAFAVVEGIAAGAMLTMIAETMLPEAYMRGGSASGFSTLVGFLAAIGFKTLE